MPTTHTNFIVNQYAVTNTKNNMFKAENVIDFANRTATVAIADIVQALKVPADCHIDRIRWRALTGQTSLTATIGDGDGADSWDASADLGTTGNRGGTLDADTYGALAGKDYASGDTIDLTIAGAAATTGKVLIVAEGYLYDNSLS